MASHYARRWPALAAHAILLFAHVPGLDAARVNIERSTEEDAGDLSAGVLPGGYHPVIIVGPLMGQSLEVRADPGSASANRLCPGRSKSFSTVWGSTSKTKLDPLCLQTTFGLTWDNDAKVGRDHAGIHVRPQGGWRGFDALNNLFGMHIWGPMIDRLEGLGYETGISLIGHPYDWRQSVASWQKKSFPLLKVDIENAVTATRSRAVVTALSMGCPYAHAFLQWTGDEWNAAHIDAFVPYAGPFNGATSALQTLLAGFLASFSKSGGSCPSCVPPVEEREAPPELEDDSLWGNFKKMITAPVMSYFEGVLTETTNSFPSVWWMVPTVDSSVDPPEDPIVLKFPKGLAPSACRITAGRSATGTSCGAGKTVDGWKLKAGFLAPDQCGECQWHSRHYLNSASPCPDEFDLAADFSNNTTPFSVLCCKRRRCSKEPVRASQLPELLRSMGRGSDADMMAYALTQPTTADPGVPVHCVIPLNVKTPELLDMESDLKVASIQYGDGDGTVHASSLQVCSRWKSTVKTYTMPDVLHGGSIMTEQSFDILVAVATDDTATWQAWTPPKKFDVPDPFKPNMAGVLADHLQQLIERVD